MLVQLTTCHLASFCQYFYPRRGRFGLIEVGNTPVLTWALNAQAVVLWNVFCCFSVAELCPTLCNHFGACMLWDLSYEVYGFYQTLCPPNLLWLLLPKWGAQTFYSLFFHKLIFNMQGSKYLWVHLNKRIISYLFMTNSESKLRSKHTFLII